MSLPIISYMLLPGVGREMPREAPLPDFLANIPYFFQFGYMPSLAVMNTALSGGLSDAGMSGGCRWQPFQVSPEEYQQLLLHFKARPHDAQTQMGRVPRIFATVPDHVRSRDEWHAWVLQEEFGAPYDKVLALSKRDTELGAKIRTLAGKSDSTEAEALLLERFQANKELQDILAPLFEKRRLERQGPAP